MQNIERVFVGVFIEENDNLPSDEISILIEGLRQASTLSDSTEHNQSEMLLPENEIFFISIHNNDTRLSSMNLRTNIVKDIFPSWSNVIDFAISPIGDRIAILTNMPSLVADYNTELVVLSLGDNQDNRLISRDTIQPLWSHDSGFYPTWSPTGMQLAFSMIQNNWVGHSGPQESSKDVLISNLDGDDLIYVGTGLYPAWSPTGTSIAFSHKGNIFVKDLIQGDVVNITNDIGYFIMPTISPDGSHVAFISTRSTDLIEKGHIFITDIHGYNLKKLTKEPALLHSPTWSPGGSHIAFIRRHPHNDVSIIDLHGNQQSVVQGFLRVGWGSGNIE